MAQRLASLLLRPVRSSSTLTAGFLSSSPASNSNQPNLDNRPDEALLLEDGKEADLQLLFSPDVATSLRYLLTMLHPPTSNPRLTLGIATFLLNPPRSASISSSPASSPKPHTRTKPESIRAAVALLFGITSLLSQPPIREDHEQRLEELSESLVGIFVKGGVRPPPAGCAKSSDLEEEVAVAILGRGNETRARCGSRSAWELSRVVVERLESRIIEMQQSQGSVSSEEDRRRRVRIGITTSYLLALLASTTTSSSSGAAKLSSRLSTTEGLFAKCIDLGLSISLVGASPSTPSLSSPHDSHASSLVWKSRKRLELSGHTSLAVLGLPSNGGGYEKWDGGAGERARLAEEKVRKVGEEKAAMRSRRSLSRLDESRLDQEGGDLLDAPRRLKGKKIAVDQRRGTYTRSSGSSTASSSGPTTPTVTHASLQIVGCPFPHHSHGDPTSLTSLSSSNQSIRTQSTTSLPSLNKKPSIHLLNMVASPPHADSSLPRDHRNDPPLPFSSALKASTPTPLPNLLDSHGIFSPSCASIEASPSPPPTTESVYDRGTKLLRRSFSRLAISFIQEPVSSPPPLPTSDPSSSSPSLPTDARGRPSIRISSLGQTSFSSGSSVTSSPPTTPILIAEAQVPKIAFQPSSFHYECFEGNHGQPPNAAGIWRPLSPRGDRVRILSGAIRGRREN